MKRKSVYVAFSNQKGGVGKSIFTTLAASYLHYTTEKNVVVVDCDFPQFSIKAMRERDIETVNGNLQYKRMVIGQHELIHKKAYNIITSVPEKAMETAEQFINNIETPVDIVFFDMSGTVYSAGNLKSMLNLDYLFCPIITDRIVMQSTLAFVATIREFLIKDRQLPLNSVHLFWNKIHKTENKEILNVYNKIIQTLHLNILQTEIPYTIRYKKEMNPSNRPFFRSTLFPPDKGLLKGSNLDNLIDEICQIINI